MLYRRDRKSRRGGRENQRKRILSLCKPNISNFGSLYSVLWMPSAFRVRNPDRQASLENFSGNYQFVPFNEENPGGIN